MGDQDDYEAFLAELRAEFPSFQLVRKSESLLMRTLGWLLLLLTGGEGRFFMLSMTTTIGYTIYTPSSWAGLPESARLRTLRHERVHMRQCRRFTLPVFLFLYLFVPLPAVFAYCRYRFEREAYKETLVALYEAYGSKELRDPVLRRSIIENFTSSNYFWMWPFRRSLERWYDETVAQISSRH